MIRERRFAQVANSFLRSICKSQYREIFRFGLIHRPKRLDATRIWGTRYGGRVVRFVIFLGVTEASGGSKIDPANAPNSPRGSRSFLAVQLARASPQQLFGGAYVGSRQN